MDDVKYKDYLEKGQAEFEAHCLRCGDCCGGDTEDPCHNLRIDLEGLYYCEDYKNRLGLQKTVGGRVFECVEIRHHISKGKLSPRCGYRRILSS